MGREKHSSAIQVCYIKYEEKSGGDIGYSRDRDRQIWTDRDFFKNGGKEADRLINAKLIYRQFIKDTD